jgi:hypothetical protein
VIFLHTTIGDYSFQLEGSETAQDLVQHLLNDLDIRLRGSWSLQETQSGRILTPSEVLVDDRYYWLSTGLLTTS